MFISLFVFSEFVLAIRINEVELNPKDECRDCTEWIELYSAEEVNLGGWIIIDKSGKSLYLKDIDFIGYYVVNSSKISLNNNEEKLFLYNNESLVYETPLLSDLQNDDRSWQFCNEWKFISSTKGEKNSCQQEESQVPLEENTNQESEGETEEVEEEKEIEEKVEKITKPESKKNETEIIKNPVIMLTGKSMNEQVYKSKNQIIKEYAIYGFAVFCVVIIILLFIKLRKLRKENE